MREHLGRRVFPSCPPSSCLVQGPELESQHQVPNLPSIALKAPRTFRPSWLSIVESGPEASMHGFPPKKLHLSTQTQHCFFPTHEPTEKALEEVCHYFISCDAGGRTWLSIITLDSFSRLQPHGTGLVLLIAAIEHTS